MLVSARYRPNIIKEYEYWWLLTSEYQVPHLGRCYAWWKDRHDGEGEGLPLCSLPQQALSECFQTVFLDVMKACGALGHQTNKYGTEFLLNTAYLANERLYHNAHMHVHFIPRFKHAFRTPQLGIRSEDSLWGKHYDRVLAHHEMLQEYKRKALNEIVAEAIA